MKRWSDFTRDCGLKEVSNLSNICCSHASTSQELLRQCWEDIAIYFLSMSSRYTVLDIDVSSECQTYYFLGSYLIIKDSGIHEIM